MRFSDIPGHEDIKQRLRLLVDDDKMPHALLLEGPAGSAKYALARALAQYLHCQNRHDGDSCGVCPSCRQMAAHNHIDTIYSFPVTKKTGGRSTVSNDYRQEFTEFLDKSPWMNFDAWLTALGNPNTMPAIYVDEGAELTRRLSYTSHASKYKIVLMWMPERMNADTANKLLKLVEEPFEGSMFIMTADNPRGILPTIYSRVQRVKVPPYDTATLAQWLQQTTDCTPQQAVDAATLSEGDINRAQRLVEEGDENGQYLEWFMSLMRNAYRRDIAALKAWSLTVDKEKRERQMRFLAYCARMLRENFVLNVNQPGLNVMTASEMAFCSKFAPYIHELNVLGLVQAIDRAITDIAGNASSKIVLFDFTITVILLLKK